MSVPSKKQQIIDYVAETWPGGTIPRGGQGRIAEKFGCSPGFVSHVLTTRGIWVQPADPIREVNKLFREALQRIALANFTGIDAPSFYREIGRAALWQGDHIQGKEDPRKGVDA